jgi:hypothetical protein
VNERNFHYIQLWQSPFISHKALQWGHLSRLHCSYLTSGQRLERWVGICRIVEWSNHVLHSLGASARLRREMETAKRQQLVHRGAKVVGAAADVCRPASVGTSCGPYAVNTCPFLSFFAAWRPCRAWESHCVAPPRHGHIVNFIGWQRLLNVHEHRVTSMAGLSLAPCQEWLRPHEGFRV